MLLLEKVSSTKIEETEETEEEEEEEEHQLCRRQSLSLCNASTTVARPQWHRHHLRGSVTECTESVTHSQSMSMCSFFSFFFFSFCPLFCLVLPRMVTEER